MLWGTVVKSISHGYQEPFKDDVCLCCPVRLLKLSIFQNPYSYLLLKHCYISKMLFECIDGWGKIAIIAEKKLLVLYFSAMYLHIQFNDLNRWKFKIVYV